jgi:hydroxyacyl-ACP dehydratase HTD2-like protein with hotdog domain
MGQISFGDVAVGDELPSYTVTPSMVQMMRYCGVTWNMHRIHYDLEQAALEGYPGVIVQSHLHQAFLTKLVTDWMGPQGRLRQLSNSVRRFATAGDELLLLGRVTELNAESANFGLVSIELQEVRTKDGVVCAPGLAIVELPVAP